MKQQILRELAETGLLAAASIHRALLANDRAKYLLTLLQLAFDGAREPLARADTLAQERLLVDIDDPLLDALIPGAREEEDGTVTAPGLERAVEHLRAACRDMVEPIRETGAPEAPELERRLEALAAAHLTPEKLEATRAWLDRLASGIRSQGDSVHLFVMDAHRVLNRLQRDLAQSRVDGVAAVGIEERDRPLVSAFVRGVRRTAALKLDHPGLDTTASRYSGRLVLQNDVGVTDSHVIVLAVTDSDVRITYTDIHSRRLAFFRQMLDGYHPRWKEIATRSSELLEEGARYYVLTGTIQAAEAAPLEKILEFIGSRLVFLIDWNKARKRLRNFVSNKVAVGVLEETARAEIGHMAFLELGGDELVYQALDVAAADYLRFGEPFQAAVGAEAAGDCFVEILRICHEGVANGDSLQVIRDRIVASITRAIARKSPEALAACRNQAALVVEAALTFSQMLRHLRLRRDGVEFLLRSARRIEAWENEADDILNRLRRREARRPSGLPLRELSGAIDDALDRVDQGAFFLARIRLAGADPELLAALDDLAALLVRCAQEFYKAIAAVSESTARRTPEDLPEFFESIGTLDHLTKLKNRREREFLEEIFASGGKAGRLQRLREIAAQVSAAADSLSRAGFLLYDSIFSPGQIGG